MPTPRPTPVDQYCVPPYATVQALLALKRAEIETSAAVCIVRFIHNGGVSHSRRHARTKMRPREQFIAYQVECFVEGF
jgi:hypothetical protein